MIIETRGRSSEAGTAMGTSVMEALVDDGPPVDEPLLNTRDFAEARNPTVGGVRDFHHRHSCLSHPGQELLFHFAVVVGQWDSKERIPPESIVPGTDIGKASSV